MLDLGVEGQPSRVNSSGKSVSAHSKSASLNTACASLTYHIRLVCFKKLATFKVSLATDERRMGDA